MLEARVAAATTERRDWQWAKIVLMAADAEASPKIAEIEGVNRNQVDLWKHSHVESGLDGLADPAAVQVPLPQPDRQVRPNSTAATPHTRRGGRRCSGGFARQRFDLGDKSSPNRRGRPDRGRSSGPASPPHRTASAIARPHPRTRQPEPRCPRSRHRPQRAARSVLALPTHAKPTARLTVPPGPPGPPAATGPRTSASGSPQTYTAVLIGGTTSLNSSRGDLGRPRG